MSDISPYLGMFACRFTCFLELDMNGNLHTHTGTMKPRFLHTPTRMLAAVMFIDLVGYTAMMQQDEERAMHLRKQKRNILEKNLKQHGGQVIQYYGDGALSIFQSAIRAVRCAMAIQKDLQRMNIRVRIGIHSGEIVRDREGIYGNTVNIASRLESLSLPGGILISGKIYSEIKNHRGITARPVGTFILKNVEEPVKIYAVNLPEIEVRIDRLHKNYETMACECANRELIQPYLNHINAGLLN